MEDRLLKLLDTEQLSSSKFADAIGVQRSSVSHILSGRNKPSFDFMQKTLKAFPLLNADWLILGEGDMYDDMSNYVSGGLFDKKDARENSVTSASQNESSEIDKGAADLASNLTHISEKPVTETVLDDSAVLSARLESSGKSKNITKVILFYDDNSFHTYEPES